MMGIKNDIFLLLAKCADVCMVVNKDNTIFLECVREEG